MILVTGGCGFIGSHLVAKLVELGHDVRVLDDFSTGKKENLEGLKNIEIMEGDVRSTQDCLRAMQDCDTVFHLAALTDARESGDKMFQVNFIGSKNIFAASKGKVIFTSSASVYGEGNAKEDSPLVPKSDYGKSKAKAERLAKDGFIVRLFNVYGPRGNSVINKFSKNICAEKEITLYGNGMQTRDYVHVNDVVDALLLGLEHEGTYNVGTGKETPLLNAVSMIEKIYDEKAKMKFEMPKEGELQRSKADISKITELGWEPKVSLEDGIKDLVK